MKGGDTHESIKNTVRRNCKSWNQNTTFLKLVSNHVFKVGDRVRIKSKKYKPGSGPPISLST